LVGRSRQRGTALRVSPASRLQLPAAPAVSRSP
jgi:hypothetical protein